MQAFDYSKLLDRTTSYTFLSSDVALDEDIYPRDLGIKFCSKRGHHLWECVHLAEGALLIASQDPGSGVQSHRQVVNQSDWVHIQFRLSGGGCESVDRTGVVQTPQGHCIVSRYAENCVVERTVDATNGCKVVCLFITPTALMYLLDAAAPRFPEHALWLAQVAHAQSRSAVLPLQPKMVLAVNDVLSCTFKGCNRRAYMRGKSLELLSTVIHALGRTNSSTDIHTLRLSAADLERVAFARSVMCAHLESTLTLRELARKAGLNRTKLALGFKAIYGTAVQAFWRDAKLDHARQLLRDEGTPVTEVALSVGYSEPSSFTRAFTRRFGITPRECKREERRALNSA